MSKLFTLAVFPQTDGYLYSFSTPDTQFIPGGSTLADVVKGMDNFLDDTYYIKLRDAMLGTFPDRGASTRLRSLGGYGRELYLSVIPPELQGAIKHMSRGNTLHIYADDFTIPWELVKNGGDFWGQLFVVSNSRLTGNARVNPSPFPLRIKKIVNVIGNGISPKAASHARQLFQSFQDKAEIQLIDGQGTGTTEDFFQHLPSADLVHFTCHGRLDGSEMWLQIVGGENSGDNLLVTSIDCKLHTGCVVFANACISSKTTTPISQSRGFGPAFCNNGAGAFIGTLDLVPELEAVLFAEAFYKKLFSGLEMGAALWAARQDLLRVGDQISFVPLLYSLYGNPCETVGFQ